MRNIVVYWLLAPLLILSGCGSNPSKSVLNPEGEQYFATNQAKYNNIEVTVSAEDEKKAVGAGYMSNAAVKKYMKKELGKQLKELELVSSNGLSIKIDLSITRGYAWMGKSDSMARMEYSSSVEIRKGKQVLGAYSLGGGAADQSIMGAFKTVFAANTAEGEGRYFDYIANKIVAKLPK